MPAIPYSISGIITDEKATAIQNALVIIYNLSKGKDSGIIKTNATGAYITDMSNWEPNYANNDILLIRAYKEGVNYRFNEIRNKVDTAAGQTTQNLQLAIQNPPHPFELFLPKIDEYEHDAINRAKKVISLDGDGKGNPKDIRFDANDSAPTYIGLNFNNYSADTSSKDWVIFKFTYSGSNATRIQRRDNVAWNDRVASF